MRPTQRLAAALVVAGFVTAACGARLSDAQREQALASGGSGGRPDVGTTGVVDPGTTGVTAPGTTGVTAPGTTGTTGGTGTSGTTGSTGTTGGSGTTGSTGGVPADFQKVPPGGNGGATDVGITSDSIIISNASDVSGAVPGLFEDARFAVQAYAKYFNARFPGGIYGRKLKVLALDSQLDTGANRSAAIQQCAESFAGVGSVSAFDQGAAPIIKNCKSKGGFFPDLRGLATTNQMKVVANAYPLNATGVGDRRSFGQYGWVAEKFPEAIKKAVMVYSDGEVTRQNGAEDIEGTTKQLGYKWVAEVAIGTTETNYGPFATRIKQVDGQFVTFVGAYQQAASLARALDQVGHKPAVYQPTVTAYTVDFLKQAGSAVQGGNVYVAPHSGILEEVAGNAELALYQQWLQQVKPGARPTAIAQFSWGAAALFVQEMIKLGPRPTRGALLERIAKIRSYSPNNMYPNQDVGGRLPTSCMTVMSVKGNSFARFTPSSGYRCKDGIYNLKTKQGGSGFPQ